MKTKLIFSVIALGLFSACDSLDTEPMNQYVTSQQKAENAEANPELLQSSITGITGLFSTRGQVISSASSERHNDFGVPAVMLFSDARGIDMVSSDIGYNWFGSGVLMDDCNPQSAYTRLAWGNYYRIIFAANSACQTIPADTKDPQLQFYLAQARALRAYAYFQLIQTYQFTYIDSQDKPGVMLITEQNSDKAAANGCPRSSVKEVYAQIMDDLNAAVNMLKNSGIKPADVLQDKPKRFLSLAAAHGLRARVNLVMNNWQAAADDAAAAIAAFDGTPLSLTQAARPGFNSIEDANWMWGIAIAETDAVVLSGIVNFPSHMGSLNYGYASVGAWRMINSKLFASIPTSDVRRGWFLDENASSPNLNEAEVAQVVKYKCPAYTQVKFAPYQGVMAQSNNASDIPLMRVEEMYYIQAEATAMAGGDGASILSQFVTTYRDPSFTGTGNVQDDCWNQRRVEFFGEGLAYFDLLRLRKPFDRTGANWEPNYAYNIAPNSNVLILPIPEQEVNGNSAFTNAANNPSAPQPKP